MMTATAISILAVVEVVIAIVVDVAIVRSHMMNIITGTISVIYGLVSFDLILWTGYWVISFEWGTTKPEVALKNVILTTLIVSPGFLVSALIMGLSWKKNRMS